MEGKAKRAEKKSFHFQERRIVTAGKTERGDSASFISNDPVGGRGNRVSLKRGGEGLQTRTRGCVK